MNSFKWMKWKASPSGPQPSVEHEPRIWFVLALLGAAAVLLVVNIYLAFHEVV